MNFSCLLLLSGMWLTRRNQSSAIGIGLGVFVLVGALRFFRPNCCSPASRPKATRRCSSSGKRGTQVSIDVRVHGFHALSKPGKRWVVVRSGMPNEVNVEARYRDGQRVAFHGQDTLEAREKPHSMRE
jgi:hypothetical protein